MANEAMLAEFMEQIDQIADVVGQTELGHPDGSDCAGKLRLAVDDLRDVSCLLDLPQQLSQKELRLVWWSCNIKLHERRLAECLPAQSLGLLQDKLSAAMCHGADCVNSIFTWPSLLPAARPMSDPLVCNNESVSCLLAEDCGT